MLRATADDPVARTITSFDSCVVRVSYLSVCVCCRLAVLALECVGLKKKKWLPLVDDDAPAAGSAGASYFVDTVTATAPGRNAADWVLMFEHAKVEIAEHGAISRRARKGTIDRGRAGGKNFELNRDLDR